MGFFNDNKLLIYTLVGVLCGCAVGFGVRSPTLSYEAQVWVKIWGELFLRILKALILPLIMACLVGGISSMDAKASGKLGAITMAYIFGTQLISVLLGIILAAVIQPGSGFGGQLTDEPSKASYTDVFADFLKNLFPDNIIRACIQSTYTTHESVFNASSNMSETTRTEALRDSMDTLGVITISIAISLGINAAGEEALPLKRLMKAIEVVVFKIMDVVLWMSPVGIASLIAGAIVGIEDLSGAMTSLAYYVLTVVVGSLIHQFVIMPILFVIILRRNPVIYYLQSLDALLLGLSTASSAPTMPILLKKLPAKMGVDDKVVAFSLPLEVVFNRDGSAMFVCIAAMFVAQTYDIVIDPGSLMVLGFVTTFLSAAIANVPSASVLLLIMVGSAINLPVHARLGLIMAVEWLLDRVRTTNNVISNAYGCAIIEYFNKQSYSNLCCDSKRRVRFRTPGKENGGNDSLNNTPRDYSDDNPEIEPLRAEQTSSEC